PAKAEKLSGHTDCADARAEKRASAAMTATASAGIDFMESLSRNRSCGKISGTRLASPDRPAKHAARRQDCRGKMRRNRAKADRFRGQCDDWPSSSRTAA